MENILLRVAQEKLYEREGWIRLLHYTPKTFGGMISEVDGKSFFLAENGKTDPLAEMQASVRAFFEPIDPLEENKHAQCRFPARFRWLFDTLSIPLETAPQPNCAEFLAWKKGIGAHSASLIFASFYANNPASMFGHTLLRFHRAPGDKRHDLLDYAVNYAANTGNDAGFLYMIFGLTGGYPGTFSLYPFYFKLQEYINFESRDLWEYHLALTPDQVSRMVDHLWEVGHTFFHYFFIDENCSYHLLSLLEVADFEANYRSDLPFFVIPSDTIKALMKRPEAVSRIDYLPSKLSRFNQLRSQLNPEEDDILRFLVRTKSSLQSSELKNLPPERQALVADTAIEYFSYAYKQPTSTPFQRKLLEERSLLPESPEVANTHLSTPPHLGHRSSRVGIGGGLSNHDSFEELHFRFAYHDLLGRDLGYSPFSEVEVFKTRGRFYNKAKSFHLEELTPINIVSLVPMDRFIRKPSWSIAFGFETLRHEECGRCQALYVKGGPGFSLKSSWVGQEVFYLLAGLNVQISPWSELNYRVGPLGRLGLIFELLPSWKLQIEGIVDISPLGSPVQLYKVKAAQRISLSTNWEFRMEALSQNGGDEATASLYVYF